jgi:translation initiation factor 3 subunit L
MAVLYDREDGAPPAPLPHAADAYDPSYVPDSVKTFVVHLYRHIRDKNVYEIHQMYEGGFQRLSDRLFRDAPWPSAAAVAPYCDGDHVFLLLYRELWYRHAHARLSPLTAARRAESWTNYCDLFSVVLHGVVNMQLPNQWLWDMVDEFVYQFQSFCQYRAKLKNKTQDEMHQLKQFDKVLSLSLSLPLPFVRVECLPI